jgi:glycosyl transferase family 2
VAGSSPLRTFAEALVIASAAATVLVPHGALKAALVLSAAGIVLAWQTPGTGWSREDRLVSFAPIAAFLMMGVARWATLEQPDDASVFLPMAPLLLTPAIILLARRASVRSPGVMALILAGLYLMPVMALGIDLDGMIPADPPMGPITVGVLGLLIAVGLPLRQMAWGFGHRDTQIRRLAQVGWLFLLLWSPGLLWLATRGVADAAAWVALLVGLFWGGLRAREATVLADDRQRDETLSVAIICKDESDRIGALLESVRGWADEIVVLDSGSTDDTVAIARRYTDHVHQTDWPGYGAQKQRAIGLCASDWVLSLDADEVPSAALKAEIDLELDGGRRYDAYRFPWVSMVFGGPVYFGADGRLHLRLFRRQGSARFDGAAVHEGIVDAGRVRTLHGWVEHYTFRDLEHAHHKFADYARIQAAERYARGRRATRVGALIRGAVSFALLYVLRLGILDGRRGLRMAVLYARYTRDKYAALAALSG